MAGSAHGNATDAAHSVSLVYPDEWAGRRERVVEDKLNSNIQAIRVALGILGYGDLSDPDHLRNYCGGSMEQAKSIISGLCRDKGVKLVCRTAGKIDDDYFGGDIKLRQIMINILGNAVKFTPQGGEITFLIEEGQRFGGKAVAAEHADRAERAPVEAR